MTVAQKSLAKVDKSGMKPMSAFFSPKVKAEKQWMPFSVRFCNKEKKMELTYGCHSGREGLNENENEKGKE